MSKENLHAHELSSVSRLFDDACALRRGRRRRRRVGGGRRGHERRGADGDRRSASHRDAPGCGDAEVHFFTFSCTLQPLLRRRGGRRRDGEDAREMGENDGDVNEADVSGRGGARGDAPGDGSGDRAGTRERRRRTVRRAREERRRRAQSAESVDDAEWMKNVAVRATSRGVKGVVEPGDEGREEGEPCAARRESTARRLGPRRARDG